MTYQVFSKHDALVVENVLEFTEAHVDNDTDKKPPYTVGDTVQVHLDGSVHHGVCGVVVHQAYGMHRIEPYNTPYYNNPCNITKIGLFSAAELKKIKKKPEWSTVYNPNAIQAVLGKESDKSSPTGKLKKKSDKT